MSTLLEINKALREFDYQFDPETGELLNGDELEELELAREAKLEGIGCLIKEARYEAEAIILEMKSLRERADARIKKAESLERWLAHELENKPFSTPRVAVTFRKSQTTDIIEERLIPQEYMVQRIKTETKPDKEKIKKAINAGKEVPGAVLTDHYNISVK